mgnify:CR=1 FL=1
MAEAAKALETLSTGVGGGAGTEPITPAATTSPGTGAGAQGYEFGGKKYSSVDELGKAYESAQSELGKWTQQNGDLRRQYENAQNIAGKWDEWWKTVSPLWGEDVEDLLRRKLTGTARQVQAQPQQTQNQFEGWDALRPEEQFSRMRQSVAEELGNAFNQQLTGLNQQWQKHLAERETWYQSYLTNHLGLMRRALEQKLINPNFDVDKVMEQAARAIGGQIDPIQLGQQLITAETFNAQIDAAKKLAYEQGKKDFEQEAANKKIESVPVQSGMPVYKMPTVTPAANGAKHGLASWREQAAEKIVKKFGPTWFSNE